MTILSTLALRLFGLSGILGSLLFIVGDLLYNHAPGSKDSLAVKMSRLPQARLLTAGTLGMIGCWFYVLASLHVYLAFRPAGAWFSLIFELAFAALMICFGISHTAYFAIASGAQAAAKLDGDAESGGKLGNTFFQRLVYITYIPVAISSLMMAYGIATGRSIYPKWMLVFMPVVIYLLKTPVTRLLKGRLQEIITETYDNFVLFVFYTISTIVLWNGLIV